MDLFSGFQKLTRSPSSALLPFFWGGFPYKNRLQKKVGTLILTSLLQDLVKALQVGEAATYSLLGRPRV